MGRAKKTRKYAATKRVLNPNDDRLKLKAAAKAEAAPIVHRESDKKKGAADASVQRSELFFSHNRALGPPFHVRWVRLVFGVGWEGWMGRSRLGEHCLIFAAGHSPAPLNVLLLSRGANLLARSGHRRRGRAAVD